MKVLLTQKVAGIAGAENYLLQVMPALKKRGVEVEFLLFYDQEIDSNIQPFIDHLERHQIRVHTLRSGRYPSFKILKAVDSLIREQKYDVVQTTLIYSDFVLALVKMLFRTPVKMISGKHGYDDYYTVTFGFDPKYKRRDLYYYMSVFVDRYMDHTFTITEGLYQLHIGLGISKPEKISIIHYGFDLDDSPEPNPEYRFGNPQMAIVGRLVGFKGHKYALQATAILKKKYPDIKLVIVGWGILEEELRAQVKALDIEDNVVFAGRQYNAREYMVSSDVVLVPSVSEGFGIVILEAVSVKRPIVAFEVYSPKELFKDKEEILLAKPYDVEEYAAHVDQLLSDTALAEAQADKAYKKLKTYYTMDRMIDQTIEMYNKVLSK